MDIQTEIQSLCGETNDTETPFKTWVLHTQEIFYKIKINKLKKVVTNIKVGYSENDVTNEGCIK